MENIKDKDKIINKSFVLIVASFLIFMFFVGYNWGDTKGMVFGIITKSKNFVYYEATVHNPEGNFLPDWIDDIILGKAREIF